MARMQNDSGNFSLYTAGNPYALWNSWSEIWRSFDRGALALHKVLSWVGRSCESIQLSRSSHDVSVLWLRCRVRRVPWLRRIDEEGVVCH